MQQDTTDLDFDTYFDVSSAQRRSSSHGNVLHHSPQATTALDMTSPLISMENGNQSTPFPPLPSHQNPSGASSSLLYSSPNTYDAVLAWDIQDASPPQSQNTLSSPDTATSLSPHFCDGDFPPTYVKHEASRALAGAYTMTSDAAEGLSWGSVAINRNVPGITIPTTPLTDVIFPPPANGHPSLSPPVSSQFSNTSPLVDGHALRGNYPSIDYGWDGSTMNSYFGTLNNDHTTRNWRKRRNDSTDDMNHIMEPGWQLKKVAHNAIERRYRNNINDRIHDLKNVVPALYKAKIKDKAHHHDDNDDDEGSASSDSDEEHLEDGVEVAKKLNKATILRKATEYIHFLKQRNAMAEQETQILQHIVSQMPGGNQVLSRFLAQKQAFEKAEHERVIQERKEKQELERAQRQQLLRERAAQRNALAQLMPKPRRQPYRRRKKPQTEAKAQENDTKVYMALFACLTFFSPSLSAAPRHVQASHSPKPFTTSTYINDTTGAAHRSDYLASSTFNFWNVLRLFTMVALAYYILYPLARRLFGLKTVSSTRPCTSKRHHHYAPDVAAAWSRLYHTLFQVIPEHAVQQTPLGLTLAIFGDLLSLCLASQSTTVKSSELNKAGAWVRLNEMECLGGNTKTSRLHLLRSCTGMFAAIHKLKRDKRHAAFFCARTWARIYATAAIQLELALPVLGKPLAALCWKQVVDAIRTGKDGKDHWFTTARDTNMVDWPTSESHYQIMTIVQARSGVGAARGSCRNVFYSFALPYLTSPLDWILYWQSLSQIQAMWVEYIDQLVFSEDHERKPIFTPSQLPSAIVSPVDQMLSWWIHLGIYLQSLKVSPAQASLDFLQEYASTSDKTHQHIHPSSSLLQRHRSMIYHTTQAIALIASDTSSSSSSSSDEVAKHLNMAMRNQSASAECIRQIAPLTTGNTEASVFILSSIAVRLQALKVLSNSFETYHKPQNREHCAPRYLCQISDQLSQDMAMLTSSSATARLLSSKCRRQIKASMSRVDDRLHL